MDSVIIIGTSGHAKVIAEAIELKKEYTIYGFIATHKDAKEYILGYKVLGDVTVLPELMEKGITKGVIAIEDNWNRKQMFAKIQKEVSTFEFITIIHPTAIVSTHAQVGKGAIILAAATISAEAVIGDFCVVSPNTDFGSESVLNKFASIASGAIVGDNVIIGAFSAVAIGANIGHNITIGQHTVIGVGAAVTSSLGSYKVLGGGTAEVISNREKGDYYLNNAMEEMMFKCHRIVTKNDSDTYKNNLKSLNHQNPFYILELLDTTDMKGYELRYFVVKRRTKVILLMPFYIRSIVIDGEETPYFDVTSPYGYGGPLYDTQENTTEILSYFWSKVDQWYQDNGIVSEFIRFSLNANYKAYTGECIPSLSNIKGNITDFEKIWVSFKPKVRNNYRKAQQEELSIKLYTAQISLDVIRDFYDIYIQTMQRNNADEHYFHFIDYFTELIENNPNGTLIAMVYKDEIPISTELILIGDSTLYSYLGGTVSDYFYTRPNDFLKIEVMKWAQAHNFNYYVLGGGRKDGDGLYKYKKSFFPNDEDVVYHTGRKIVNKEVYKKLTKQRFGNDATTYIDEMKSHYFPIYRKKEL